MNWRRPDLTQENARTMAWLVANGVTETADQIADSPYPYAEDGWIYYEVVVVVNGGAHRSSRRIPEVVAR
jgi:hypothetical protein